MSGLPIPPPAVPPAPTQPTPSTPPITSVTGGSEGLEMQYVDALALADCYDGAGSRLRHWSWLGPDTMADLDLLASAPLSPGSFADAEVAVLGATTGGDGVLVESVGWEADALAVRATVGALRWADREAERILDATAYGLAVATGCAARVGAGLAVGAALTVPGAVLPVVGVGALATRLRSPLPGVQRWVTAHPGLVQRGIGAAGGVVDGLVGLGHHPTAESSARMLATHYRDGDPEVRRRRDLEDPTHGSRPAGSLAGLMERLARANDLSPPGRSGDQGTIEVQTIADRSGRRHVVYLPGTDDLTTLPWTQDDDVRDMGTNFRMVGLEDDAYRRGILDAMAAAGIEPGDRVLLVGHSQGGMAAAALLADGTPYDIRQVVTAGSPTAHLPGFPAGTRVLSLENEGDLVPLLDGNANSSSAEQVTVRFDDRSASVGDNHDLERYVRGARAVEEAPGASVRDQLDALRRSGFLDAGPGARVSASVWQVMRMVE